MGKEKHKHEYGLQWNSKMTLLLIWCFLLFLLCLSICFYHVYSVVESFRVRTDTSILAQTELDGELVGSNLRGDIQILKSTAEQFQLINVFVGEISADQGHRLLYGAKQNTGIERLVLINRDGTVLSSERYSTMSGYERYLPKEDMGDSVVIQKTDYEFGDGKGSYVIVVPIRRNGILLGYLMGFNSTARLLSGTEVDSYANITGSYVIDSDGAVMSSAHSVEGFMGSRNNFYNAVRDNLSDDEDPDLTEARIRKELSKSSGGKVEFASHSDTTNIFYTSINDQDGWKYITVISDQAVNNMVRRTVIGSIFTNFVIIMIMTLIAVMVWRFVLEERKTMSRLAYEDSLTKAPNERFFLNEAARLLQTFPADAYRMVSFDIQNFRYLNESYGHMKADHVLRALAQVCEKDISTRETYARIGADRFVVLLVDDGRTQERIYRWEERVSRLSQNEVINYPIKLKCGFYEIADHKEPISSMIDKSNLARKSISAQSRELSAVYREDLMEETRRIEFVESKMEFALATGEFVPYLQPKWNMRHDHIVGAEALVRWATSSGEIIPPGNFIPIFEKNGFIEKVDFYMLEAVCKYIREMLDAGRQVYPISVNQSRYLLHDADYTFNVQQTLLKYKIPKGLIDLELTETVFFQERERMIEVMNELKSLNLLLSIDDFGSGYSSLNLLRDIPFDTLKIDGGFLNETNASEAGKLILNKIVEMAEGLGVHVICEGVETREQIEMLLEIGCDYAQGYYYSKPIPLQEFIEKYNLPTTE